MATGQAAAQKKKGAPYANHNVPATKITKGLPIPYTIAEKPHALTVKDYDHCLMRSCGWSFYECNYRGEDCIAGFFGHFGHKSLGCSKMPNPAHIYCYDFFITDVSSKYCHTELIQYMSLLCSDRLKQVVEDVVAASLPITICSEAICPMCIIPIAQGEKPLEIIPKYIFNGGEDKSKMRFLLSFHCHCGTPFGLFCQCFLPYVTSCLTEAVDDPCNKEITVWYELGTAFTKTVNFKDWKCRLPNISLVFH